jgi:hypothetical protein
LAPSGASRVHKRSWLIALLANRIRLTSACSRRPSAAADTGVQTAYCRRPS